MREALDLVQSRIVEQAAEMRANTGANSSRIHRGVSGGGSGGSGGGNFADSRVDNHGAEGGGQGGDGDISLTVKANAHVRITHLPPLSDLCKPNISSIRGTDLGSLIQIQVCWSVGVGYRRAGV